jgi:hypothetical protein
MTMTYPFPVSGDEFKGKRVLVTGGTKGMGQAMVRRFTLSGASVATTARSPLPTLVEHEARTSDADLTRMGYLQTDREERIVSETAAVCSQFSYVGRCILLRKFVYLGSCWRFLNNGSVLISGSPGSRSV